MNYYHSKQVRTVEGLMNQYCDVPHKSLDSAVKHAMERHSPRFCEIVDITKLRKDCFSGSWTIPIYSVTINTKPVGHYRFTRRGTQCIGRMNTGIN